MIAGTWRCCCLKVLGLDGQCKAPMWPVTASIQAHPPLLLMYAAGIMAVTLTPNVNMAAVVSSSMYSIWCVGKAFQLHVLGCQ